MAAHTLTLKTEPSVEALSLDGVEVGSTRKDLHRHPTVTEAD